MSQVMTEVGWIQEVWLQHPQRLRTRARCARCAGVVEGERLAWPGVLDITMRADTAYLLSHVLADAAQLPVRTLALAPQVYQSDKP